MSTRSPIASSLPDSVSYVFSENGVNRLWRAQQAATLLAALATEAVSFVNVSRDSTAAVAECIAQGAMDVLNQAQRISPVPTTSLGPDPI